jgi:hypothetical protein
MRHCTKLSSPRHWAPLLALVLTSLLPSSGAAQTQNINTIGELVDALFLPSVPFNPDNEPLITLADYERRSSDSREGIAIGLGTALASFPVGASSAGFTYQVNRATGERQLKAVSFGPVFVDRALTNGRGVLNMGVAYQNSRFDTLQGVDLKTQGFPTQRQTGVYSIDGSGVGDVWRTAIDVSSHIGLFSGSIGVTDNLDLGWAVPFISLSVRGQFLRDYNGGRDWDANLVANGVPIRTLYPNKIGTETVVDRTIDASGVGDIVLRAKYGFTVADSASQRIHISADVRLPTGDEENLIGSGKLSSRITVGGSIPLGGSAFLNANGGYSVGGLTDEAYFSVGTEVATLPSKQLTLTAELIGQNLRDTVTRLSELTSFDRVLVNAPDGFLPRRVTVSYGFWDRGSTTLLRGAVGAKYAFAGNWLLTASAMFRLNDNGYQAKVVPFVGLEHTWSGR